MVGGHLLGFPRHFELGLECLFPRPLRGGCGLLRDRLRRISGSEAALLLAGRGRHLAARRTRSRPHVRGLSSSYTAGMTLGGSASAGDGNENAAKESCRTPPTRTPSPHPDKIATEPLRLDPPGSAIQIDQDLLILETCDRIGCTSDEPGGCYKRTVAEGAGHTRSPVIDTVTEEVFSRLRPRAAAAANLGIQPTRTRPDVWRPNVPWKARARLGRALRDSASQAHPRAPGDAAARGRLCACAGE